MRSRVRRRRLSMTSLIDVIFLLLLFFMLSSTFTRFSEIEFSASGPGGRSGDAPPVFLSLASETLRLNGRDTTMDTLPSLLADHRADKDTPLAVLVAARADVTAQRLVDLLAALKVVPDVQITVLEGP